MKKCRFSMVLFINFAETMFFTTQNKLFHEIEVFFFFLLFQETLQLGGAPPARPPQSSRYLQRPPQSFPELPRPPETSPEFPRAPHTSPDLTVSRPAVADPPYKILVEILIDTLEKSFTLPLNLHRTLTEILRESL